MIEPYLFFSTAVCENCKYGLSCCNFRKLKYLESWIYSMASNYPHTYRRTWVCASVILVPSKIIGIGFHESKHITILMGKLTYDCYNIKIGIVHRAVWSSIGFRID